VTYSSESDEVWTEIEMQPKRRERVTLPDGTHVERNVSECHILLPQGEEHTPVILGEPGDAALLGVITLDASR